MTALDPPPETLFVSTRVPLRARFGRAALLDLASAARIGMSPGLRAALSAEGAAVHDAASSLEFAARRMPPGPVQLTPEILPFLELCRERSVKTVCEIGTQTGASTFMLARGIPGIRWLAGIDLRIRRRRLLETALPTQTRLVLLQGSSYDARTFDAFSRALGAGQLDLLFIDGDHRYGGVVRDYLLYRRFVRPGGLVAFHDIVPDHGAAGSPTGRCAGDVPRLWQRLRGHARHHEIVDAWDQDGLGIGVLEHQPGAVPADVLLPLEVVG